MAFQVIDAVGLVLARALQGAGDVVFVMAAECVVAWATAIPIAFLGAHLLPDTPLVGVWCGWAAYTIGWALAMGGRFRGERWTKIRV